MIKIPFMTVPPESYTFPWVDQYRLLSADVDCWQTLRPGAIPRLLQETAWNHAKHLKIDYSNPQFASIHWVLTRLYVQITGPLPVWEDLVLVHTQPTGVDRLFAIREYLLTTQDGREFARATSSWVIIDADTRRIQKPQPLIKDIVLPDVAPLFQETAKKITQPNDLCWESLAEHICGYNEVDLHKHVNNVRYMEWFLQSYPRTRFEQYALREWTINYTAEAGWGDRLITQMCCPGGDSNACTEQDGPVLEDYFQILHRTDSENPGGQAKPGAVACSGILRWYPLRADHSQ